MSHAAWFEQAESDLRAARILSDANLHSQAIWLASQAVEKGHKAILAALGLRYEDKHFKHLGHGTGEIAKLLPEALQEPIDTNVARMVASLETRAAASRYPAPVRWQGTVHRRFWRRHRQFRPHSRTWRTPQSSWIGVAAAWYERQVQCRP
jgi:HEPN domain-containing protein